MAMGNLNRLKNDNNTLYIKAKNVIPHPKYDPYSFDNDVGIIKVKVNLLFSNNSENNYEVLIL